MHLNILVEGQTEEMFTKELLSPYLEKDNISVTPILVSTKRLRSGLKFKGGLCNGNFNLFESDLKRLITSTPHGLVTTFIDYYALPSSFPGYQDRLNLKTPLQKVQFLEDALFNKLGSPVNFLPYIQLHEFEGLLFTDVAGFQKNIEDDGKNITGLNLIVSAYANPEDINEGDSTAPSKRILNLYPKYDKIVEGNLIALDIGIDLMLEKCAHFRNWITKIREFATK